MADPYQHADVGSYPVAIALEAQSAAHEVKRDAADRGARQAEVNIDFRQRFDRIDAAVMALHVELAEMRGEARGGVKSQKTAAVWLGLAVAAIELLSHLPWDRIIAHA
jgi:hypothetical protein